MAISRYTMLMTGEYYWRRVSDGLVEIEHPTECGAMLVSYNVSAKQLGIEDMNVVHAYRRQGIGTEMLCYAKYVAEQIGAVAITSNISSREAYEAAVTVFGADAMNVKRLANFLEPEDGSEPGLAYQSNVCLLYEVSKA